MVSKARIALWVSTPFVQMATQDEGSGPFRITCHQRTQHLIGTFLRNSMRWNVFVKYRFEHGLAVCLDPKAHLSGDKIGAKMVPFVQPAVIGTMRLMFLRRPGHDRADAYDAPRKKADGPPMN